MKTCSKCGERFELLPNKPGFANVCPSCTDNATQSARKVAEQEKLRRSLLKSKSINKRTADKKRKRGMILDQTLETLGFEWVPGKNEVRRIPAKKRVAK